jgi:hypothetical protein
MSAISKSRPLPPATPTTEDLQVWLIVLLRMSRSSMWEYAQLRMDYRESDHRDAELMLCAQAHRGCLAHWASWRRHAVLLRGAPK